MFRRRIGTEDHGIHSSSARSLHHLLGILHDGTFIATQQDFRFDVGLNDGLLPLDVSGVIAASSARGSSFRLLPANPPSS